LTQVTILGEYSFVHLDRPDGFGGVTLLELMRFYAERYLALVNDLSRLEIDLQVIESLRAAGNPDEMPLTEAETQKAYDLLRRVGRLCSEIGLDVCRKHTDDLRENRQLFVVELQGLKKNMERELSCRCFVSIAPERIKAFTESLGGWREVAERFSAASDDIEEMNKCFALCRYSSSVFHSLMVVEHGLVALGKVLGANDPKEGWDASCKKLAQVVEAGYKANTTGLDFDFLSQLNVCAQAMKLAWRNKINHATGKPIVMSGGFSPYVAEEIISASRAFMRRLTEGLPI
jgi:hypothetical protein